MLSKMITIDLSTENVTIDEIEPEVLKMFLGGRGLADWVVYHEIEASIDPLSPENILVLANGSLAGSVAPGATRLQIAARSPQTGLIGYANVGGNFGAALMKTGYQLLVIRSRAKQPSYLYIDTNEVEIRNAENLWGCDTWDTEAILNKELGKDIEVLMIGPAGENRVLFSSIQHGHHSAAGRSGMGAVMGSKNLKAIITRRDKKSVLPEAEAVSAAKEYVRHIKDSPRFERFSTLGIPEGAISMNEAGVLNIRNFNDQHTDDVEEISGEKFFTYVTKSKSCYRCPVHCKAEVKIAHGKYAGYRGARPEWETISALGFKCGMYNAEDLIHLSDLCNRLGMDSVSTGALISFAMDLYCRKIISREDADGIELTWGNSQAIEQMMYGIAFQKGFGRVLSQGVKQAAKIIGRGAEKYGYHVKGLELSAVDLRSVKGLALGCAVSSRGCDFNNVYTTPGSRWTAKRSEEQLGTDKAVDQSTLEAKELLVKRCLSVCAALDCLGLCKIASLSIIVDFDLEKEAALVRGITGSGTVAGELLQVGERVLHLERLINLRLGATPQDDRLPDMFYEISVPSGPKKGQKLDNFASAVSKFYSVMGWDSEGIPEKETLQSCKLDSLILR